MAGDMTAQNLLDIGTHCAGENAGAATAPTPSPTSTLDQETGLLVHADVIVDEASDVDAVEDFLNKKEPFEVVVVTEGGEKTFDAVVSDVVVNTPAPTSSPTGKIPNPAPVPKNGDGDRLHRPRRPRCRGDCGSRSHGSRR